MKVKVNKDDCIGCGMCEQICPEVFKVEETSEVIGEVTEELKESVEEAIESCPTSAIVNEDEKEA